MMSFLFFLYCLSLQQLLQFLNIKHSFAQFLRHFSGGLVGGHAHWFVVIPNHKFNILAFGRFATVDIRFQTSLQHWKGFEEYSLVDVYYVVFNSAIAIVELAFICQVLDWSYRFAPGCGAVWCARVCHQQPILG